MASWGAPTAWADAVTQASLSALANGSIAVGSVIDNSVNDYQWGEVSFVSTGTAISVSAGGFIGVYLLPLLHDGTSYPNNGTTGSSLPSASYLAGIIGLPNGSIVPAGSTRFQVPWGSWKIGIANRTGVALASGTTINRAQYRLLSEV